MTSFRFRSALASLLLAVSGSVAALLPSPSLALERLRMTLPLLETAVTLELGQAQTAQQLLKANPDLAELDQVGEGAVTRVLEQMLTALCRSRAWDLCGNQRVIRCLSRPCWRLLNWWRWRGFRHP